MPYHYLQETESRGNGKQRKMGEPMRRPAAKMVYCFSNGRAEGDASMRKLLGGKGANLAEMTRIGLPVPSGFTITTEVCTAYHANGRNFPADLDVQVNEALAHLGKICGASLGDAHRPLLVSVRSGGRVSMPGMMDTILNLGLNDDTVQGLAQQSSNACFAYDTYRRFIQMYASVVLDIDNNIFEGLLDTHKNEVGAIADTDLAEEDWQHIVQAFKEVVERESGQPFPRETRLQLWQAISAVFKSWHNARAQTYRRLYDIPDHWGTAVTIQAMVFGNMGKNSATGIAFTRNPSTGNKEIYGEFIVNAQGEDLVAGIRTPRPLTETGRKSAGERGPSLETCMPHSYQQLVHILQKLERHCRDMQDVEFTIQQGRLWILQTRPGKRTLAASVKIAVDLAREGILTQSEAVMRIEPGTLEQLLRPTIAPSAVASCLTMGLAASPGAARGEIVFNSDDAVACKARGRHVILVRIDTSPEDIHGMYAADGILTARGGVTSHAAVVARGIGRPCVSGASALQIDYTGQRMHVRGQTFKAGDLLTIDGTTGGVFKGTVDMREPEIAEEVGVLAEWTRKMHVSDAMHGDDASEISQACETQS